MVDDEMAWTIMTKSWRLFRGAVAAACVAVSAQAGTVQAHPIDEFLQSAYLSLQPDHLTIELFLTPGLLVAPGVAALIDADGNDAFSRSEASAYAARMLRDVSLTVDGHAIELKATDVQLPEPSLMRDGGGEIRMTATANLALDAADVHQLVFANRHAPVKSSHQATMLIPTSKQLAITGQSRGAAGESITVDFQSVAAEADSGSQPAGATDHANALMSRIFGVSVLACAALVAGGLHLWRRLGR